MMASRVKARDAGMGRAQLPCPLTRQEVERRLGQRADAIIGHVQEKAVQIADVARDDQGGHLPAAVAQRPVAARPAGREHIYGIGGPALAQELGACGHRARGDHRARERHALGAGEQVRAQQRTAREAGRHDLVRLG